MLGADFEGESDHLSISVDLSDQVAIYCALSLSLSLSFSLSLSLSLYAQRRLAQDKSAVTRPPTLVTGFNAEFTEPALRYAGKVGASPPPPSPSTFLVFFSACDGLRCCRGSCEMMQAGR